MVVIRLSRGGSKKTPFFNLVVADSRNARDGRFIERVGFYNPFANGQAEVLRVNQARVSYWESVGAQLSDTVKRLVKLHATGSSGIAEDEVGREVKATTKKEVIAKKAKEKAPPAEQASVAKELASE